VNKTSNPAELTDEMMVGLLFADRMSDVSLGRDIVLNLIDDAPFPEKSRKAVEHMYSALDVTGDFIRGLYPNGLPKVKDPRSMTARDALYYTPTGRVKGDGPRMQNLRPGGGEAHQTIQDFLDSIFGERRSRPEKSTEDTNASDHVEGRPTTFVGDVYHGPIPGELVEADTDAMDEILFGDGAYKEPAGQSVEQVENVLLRTTLLSQTIVGLQTLQALFDDTDFDDLLEEMVDNLTEKRDSLLVE
jgi:hypothetical protein